jgi:hypothetical protein
MKTRMRAFPVPMLAAVLMIGAAPVHAQTRAIVQAEMGLLDAATRAEVEASMRRGGQTERGVMETMLLNNIQLRYPAQRIVVIDFVKEMVSYQTPAGDVRVLGFDPRTLMLK